MRATPMALGLLQLAWIGAGGAGACAGVAWATTVGDAPLPAALVAAAGVSSVVTATGAARCSSGAAWAGEGAAPVSDAFCKKIAPKIAAHTTIASVDAIAARRIVRPSKPGDAASPGTQQTRVSAYILNPTLSGQFEAESTGPAIIRAKRPYHGCPASWEAP